MVNSSAPGSDLIGTGLFAVEIKGRNNFDPSRWYRQAKNNAKEKIPVVVMRPNGLGPASVDDWFVFLSQGDFLGLVEGCGLGHITGPYGGAFPSETQEDSRSGIGERLGSKSDHVSHAAVEDLLSSLLHCLGAQPGNYEVQVTRR